MRPIDADKLKAYKCSICDNRERCEDREQVCSEIAEIDEQPTIEAEPVKYAKAVKIFNDPYTGRMFTTCSMCNGKISPKDTFCKHCGAKMDGDET